MTRLYFLCFVVAVILAAFFVGQSVGNLRCRERIAVDNINNNETVMQKIGGVNAKTYHTGTDDIRRILREQYTIAD